MQPTPKLRFVRRAVPDKTLGDNISVYKYILQQWWEDRNMRLAVQSFDKYGTPIPMYQGEWRDIPTEQE
jgi:hypothetical protein